ncbi:MAG: hypothetical protein IMY71_10235 [Bacteroidetes bacterium]|nr:hypothetical protein [Bacteroidota bacterium]
MKGIRKSIPVIFSALVILSTSGLNSFSQNRDKVLDTISIRLEKFNNFYSQEKVYLHFDKPFYIPGETIWYKAYLVNASGNVPSSLSKIIYTELLDKNGEVVIRQILKAGDGFAKGEFLLPESLLQGKYQVRAYTNWMRNFDQEFFFTKEILLFDPQKEYDIPETDSSEQATGDKPANEKIDLQFFPEGGYLVSGLTSKVAFKAIDESGGGIHVKGEITDQDGNVITPYESFHLGMGVFMLKPEKGKTYFANLVQEDNKKINYALPVVLEEGLVMAADNSSGDVIRVIVQANETFLSNNSGKVLLVIQAAGRIYYTANGNFSNRSSFTAILPKTNLPAGIAQLTLFNADGNPECERLVFINRHHALQVKIETDKNTYNPREKVLLDISVSDLYGNPVAGNFSLAVTDISQVVGVEKYSDNILTNLLLTSELKGNIEQPAFYFIKDNPDSETASDYLMLTQGWRRFLWKEILNNKWPTINYDIEKSILVRKGQVLDALNDSSVASIRVSFLMLKEKKAYSRFTNKNGFLDYYINAIYGKEYLFFDVADAKMQHGEFKIMIEDNLQGYQSTGRNEILYKSPEIRNCLGKIINRAQIESSYNYSAGNNLFYKADLETKNQGTKTNSNFWTADHTIRLDEYNPFPTMTEVFREIVTHVSLKYKKGENKIRIYSDEYMKNFDHQPLFFINRLPTFDKSFVLNLNPDDIETIEVINSFSKIRQFGFLGENGVIAIYTKKGTLTSADIPDNNIIEFQGCYNSREFYSPEYGNIPETDKSKPDLRSLIYWNPLVITDSDGKASVSFYNTDNNTTINAKIEGISYNGTPGLAGFKYKIIPPE